MSAPIRAVAFDLFDTLVRWSPERLPRLRFRDKEFPSTMPLLEPMLAEAFGESWSLEKWLEVYFVVLEEIAADRLRTAIEVTCHERFARTLERLGRPRDGGGAALAERLTRAHMSHVRAVTAAPAENVALVRRLAERYRLAVLSNFDDGRTGHEVVRDTGVGALFEKVMISADEEIRKPNPEIFRRLLAALDLAPGEVLFVGDTPREDVAGAHAVGMPIAWIDHGRKEYPSELAPPTHRLTRLTDLAGALGL